MRSNRLVVIALGMATAFSTQVFAQSPGSASGASRSSDLKGDSDNKAARTFSQPAKELKDCMESKDMTPIRASKLMGINVTSKEGENLGQVQDLVIDPSTGQIRFALVGQGFMAGLGHQMIPVPWKAVNVHSEREFALNVDKEKIKSAPAWSQSDLEQPDYILRIYRFYELEPQSDVGVGTPGASETESGQGQGNSSDEQQQSGQSKDQGPQPPEE